MKGRWCLLVLNVGGFEVGELFQHRPGKYLRKNCFKFFKGCVTLGPKREPLQLLSSEGLNHTGHLVLIAQVGALVSY